MQSSTRGTTSVARRARRPSTALEQSPYPRTIVWPGTSASCTAARRAALSFSGLMWSCASSVAVRTPAVAPSASSPSTAGQAMNLRPPNRSPTRCPSPCDDSGHGADTVHFLLRGADRASRGSRCTTVGSAPTHHSPRRLTMEFENVIRGRRSIRAYTSQPVPPELVREILDEARWAPSSRNTQAWNVWVVTGDTLARFKTAFKAALDREEDDASDLAGDADRRLAAGLLGARGRADEDPRGDAGSGRRSIGPGRLHGAHGRLLRRPRPARVRVRGLPRSGVCELRHRVARRRTSRLAAHDKGLGTCQSTTLVRYPGLLRDLLPGSEEKRMVVAATLAATRTSTLPPTPSRAHAPTSTRS